MRIYGKKRDTADCVVYQAGWGQKILFHMGAPKSKKRGRILDPVDQEEINQHFDSKKDDFERNT